MSYFILMGRRIPKQAITGFKFQNETEVFIRKKFDMSIPVPIPDELK